MKTIIVLFHPAPDKSKRNALIQSHLEQLPNLTYHIISQYSFDPIYEQTLLKQFDRIIFQYPLYNYNIPGIGKLFLDSVLDKKLFRNKRLRIIVTTGQPRMFYKTKLIQTVFKSWECVSELCGFVFEEPFVLFGLQKESKIVELKKLLRK
ncbi:NADPH_oxidoreductase [Hexamita inflata]|uniref:NADPH oxidoreductase n=1 Tax=Hexamita inflata TaxID=28002 RepID=A0AA86R6E6_9EUKA|nr:NADPH oxidoreductase [Hexamita inflata]